MKVGLLRFLLLILHLGLLSVNAHPEKSYQDFSDPLHTSSKILPKELDALNACIEYVNETVFLTRWLQQGLVAYNMHANYYNGVDFENYAKNGNLSISTNNFEVPTKLFRETEAKLKHLPNSNREALADGLAELQTTLIEMQVLRESLTSYLEKQLYREDNLELSQTILSEFEGLYQKMDKQVLKIYTLTLTCYADFQYKVAPSWQRVYNSTLENFQASQKVLSEVKYHYFHPEDSNTVNLRGLVENLQETLEVHGDPLVASIPSKRKELSSSLEKALEAGQRLYSKVSDLRVELLDDQLTFVRITYHSNQSTVFYNKFVKSSGQDWLLFPQQPFLFKYIQPTSNRLDLPDPSNLPLKSDLPISEISLDAFAPSHLVFLLDISKSMRDEDKLPLLRRSLLNVLPILRPVDTVTLVTFAGKAEVILSPTSLNSQEQIIASLDKLLPEGSTDLGQGLRLAYRMANDHFIQNGNNRIILATDGLFTIDAKMLKMVQHYSKADIRLSVFNYGQRDGDKSTSKLKKLTQKGRGNYTAISPSNADMNLLKELMSKLKE
ncbi:MAG: VWA domain-containing protein [Bacteroidota bacterium]